MFKKLAKKIGLAPVVASRSVRPTALGGLTKSNGKDPSALAGGGALSRAIGRATQAPAAPVRTPRASPLPSRVGPAAPRRLPGGTAARPTAPVTTSKK